MHKEQVIAHRTCRIVELIPQKNNGSLQLKIPIENGFMVWFFNY